MSKEVLKSWTRSSTEIVEISHTWTIEHFSLQNEKQMLSSIFSSSKDVNKREWQMEIYPNGCYGKSDKGYLSLGLVLIKPIEEAIAVNYSFTIYDETGNSLDKREKSSNSTFNETSNIWRCTKFCKRNDILKKLRNDILNITCDLNYINGILKTFSGTEESSLQQKPVPCNLIENFGAMLNNNDFSDITVFILGEDEERTEYKAHKAILAARSPYFEAMFKHNFKEKAENRVEIKDVKPEVFKEMLTYIYTGKIEPQNLNENDAKEILVAADRFALDNLKTAVKNLLVSKLNVENVSELLVLGHVHSAETLKTRASNFVAANLEQVMKTEGWKLMIRDHPNLMEPILGAVNGSKITERQIDTSDSD